MTQVSENIEMLENFVSVLENGDNFEKSITKLDEAVRSETQALLKAAENEKQRIQILEIELEAKQRAIKEKELAVESVSDEVNVTYRYFDQLRSQTESLKISNKLTEDHEHELTKKLAEERKKSKSLREEMELILKESQNTWNVYYQKYESSRLAQEYLAQKAKFTVVEEMWSAAQKTLQSLQQQLSEVKGNTTAEISKAVVKIAEIKHNTSLCIQQMLLKRQAIREFKAREKIEIQKQQQDEGDEMSIHQDSERDMVEDRQPLQCSQSQDQETVELPIQHQQAEIERQLMPPPAPAPTPHFQNQPFQRQYEIAPEINEEMVVGDPRDFHQVPHHSLGDKQMARTPCFFGKSNPNPQHLRTDSQSLPQRELTQEHTGSPYFQRQQPTSIGTTKRQQSNEEMQMFPRNANHVQSEGNFQATDLKRQQIDQCSELLREVQDQNFAHAYSSDHSHHQRTTPELTALHTPAQILQRQKHNDSNIHDSRNEMTGLQNFIQKRQPPAEQQRPSQVQKQQRLSQPQSNEQQEHPTFSREEQRGSTAELNHGHQNATVVEHLGRQMQSANMNPDLPQTPIRTQIPSTPKFEALKIPQLFTPKRKPKGDEQMSLTPIPATRNQSVGLTVPRLSAAQTIGNRHPAAMIPTLPLTPSLQPKPKPVSLNYPTTPGTPKLSATICQISESTSSLLQTTALGKKTFPEVHTHDGTEVSAQPFGFDVTRQKIGPQELPTSTMETAKMTETLTASTESEKADPVGSQKSDNVSLGPMEYGESDGEGLPSSCPYSNSSPFANFEKRLEELKKLPSPGYVYPKRLMCPTDETTEGTGNSGRETSLITPPEKNVPSVDAHSAPGFGANLGAFKSTDFLFGFDNASSEPKSSGDPFLALFGSSNAPQPSTSANTGFSFNFGQPSSSTSSSNAFNLFG